MGRYGYFESESTPRIFEHDNQAGHNPHRFLQEASDLPFLSHPYCIRTHRGMPHPSGTLTDLSRSCNQELLPLRFTASELPVTACPSLLLRKVAYVRFAVTSPSSCSFFRSSIEYIHKRLQSQRSFSPSTTR